MIDRVKVQTSTLNLTSRKLVLQATPSADEDKQCQVYVELGDGINNLDGSGGIFELTLRIGGQNVQPAPQLYEFGNAPRAAVKTNSIVIPAGQEVKAFIRSPNPGDTNIAVRAYLFRMAFLDPIEIIIDPDDLRDALGAIDIPNKRVVLGACRSSGTPLDNRVVFGPICRPRRS